MKLQQSLRNQDHLKCKINDLFMKTRIYKMTFDEHLKGITEIKKSKDWTNSPQWVQTYLEGWIDCKAAALHEYELWNLWESLLEPGKLLNEHEIGGDNPTKWSEVRFFGIYWKSTDRLFCEAAC